MFLPVDLDRNMLIDITQLDAEFRRYVDKKTGKIYDGNRYAFVSPAEMPNIQCFAETDRATTRIDAGPDFHESGENIRHSRG